MFRSGVVSLITVAALAGVVTGQDFQWSPCSKTCGNGTKSRSCRADDKPACSVRYEDCFVAACPQARCDNYKYLSVSECCTKSSEDTCGVVKTSSVARKIFGGSKSKDGEWPWHVALLLKVTKGYICGGALINNKWIVTAAHCFTEYGFKAEHVVVLAGITRLSGRNPDEQSSEIETYKIHPNHTSWTNDVALAKLKKPFRYSAFVSPICFPNSEVVQEDATCYIAGWGAGFLKYTRQSYSATTIMKEPSNDLRHVGLRVLPLDACRQAYRGQKSYAGVNDNAICAGILSGGKDSCKGDSGGALACQRKHSCQWYLAGIMSYGDRTCRRKYAPGIYMNAKKYQTWMAHEIEADDKKKPTQKKLHPCDLNPCQNGGKCIQLRDSRFRCECSGKHTGRLCDKWRRPHPCDRNACSNGGKCVRLTGNAFRCDCKSGYAGKTCLASVQRSCRKNYCKNGGSCESTPYGLQCHCPVGFEGRKCQTSWQEEWSNEINSIFRDMSITW